MLTHFKTQSFFVAKLHWYIWVLNEKFMSLDKVFQPIFCYMYLGDIFKLDDVFGQHEFVVEDVPLTLSSTALTRVAIKVQNI